MQLFFTVTNFSDFFTNHSSSLKLVAQKVAVNKTIVFSIVSNSPEEDGSNANKMSHLKLRRPMCWKCSMMRKDFDWVQIICFLL